MKGWLFAVSIGSPQDFVGHARRTRDIWFGSLLLADLSRRVALKIEGQKDALLIAPHPLAPEPESVPHPKAALRFEPDLSCDNQVIAWLPDKCDPEMLGKDLREVVRQRWNAWAAQTKTAYSVLIDDAIWKDQIAHAPVDVFVAWTSFTGDANYKHERATLMQRLAERKTLRDFVANPVADPALAARPKSSLDGVTESVLIVGKNREETRNARTAALKGNRELDFRLRLGVDEELDATGFIKRAATGQTFPSVTRVAIEPWVREVIACGKKSQLDALLGLAKKRELIGDGANRSATSGTGEHYEDWPLDGAFLLRDRLDALIKEAKDDAEKVCALKKLRDGVKKLHDEFQFPQPYYALILADGDGVGELVSGCETRDVHQNLSKALQDFAGAARGIIKRHVGVTVFAAGEDLLAFCPLDTVCQAVIDLGNKYFETLKAVVSESDPAGNGTAKNANAPTLSAGVVIGHCHDSLDDLLGHARAAKARAKGFRKSANFEPRRNAQGNCTGAVALHWEPRGGAGFDLVGDFDLLDRMQVWTKAHVAGALADSIGYDLLRLGDTYGAHWKPDQAAEALRLELRHLLLRRQIKDKEIKKRLRETAEKIGDAREEAGPLCLRVGQEIVLARRIATACKQAPPVGTPEAAEETA